MPTLQSCRLNSRSVGPAAMGTSRLPKVRIQTSSQGAARTRVRSTNCEFASAWYAGPPIRRSGSRLTGCRQRRHPLGSHPPAVAPAQAQTSTRSWLEPERFQVASALLIHRMTLFFAACYKQEFASPRLQFL